MNNRTSFMGVNGFVWWLGIVENRKDPINLGRCQIRIFGWHSEDKKEIPTSALPWAQPLLPTNGSRAFSTPKEGDQVMGFFLDGESGQFPIMMGVLPGIPETKPNYQKGFSDPRTSSELKSAPSTPERVTYKTDGSGVDVKNKSAETYPNKDKLNEPVVTRMGRNEKIEETPLNDSKENNVKRVPVSQYNNINPNLSSLKNISTGFNALSGLGGIFGNLTSLIPSSLTNIMSMIQPSALNSLNIPSIVSSNLSKVVPSSVSSIITNSASNVGVLSSMMTDLGVSSFNSNNPLHIESLAKLSGISTINLTNIVKVYDSTSNTNLDFNNLKEQLLTESNIDLSNFSDAKIISSIKNSGVDVNAIESTFSLNNIDSTSFLKLDSFTSELNKLGISVLSGSKQSSDTQWTEPKTKYNTKYPYNTVLVDSESGHTIYVDDTVDHETINIRHRTGTFVEMHPDGSKVDKVVKDRYSIVMSDDHVDIMGNCKITINGNAKLYVVKDCTMTVDGNLNTTIKKDWNLNIDGNVNWNVGKSVNNVIKGDCLTAIQKDWAHTVNGKSILTSKGDLTESTSGKLTLSSQGKLYMISSEAIALDAPSVNTNHDSD